MSVDIVVVSYNTREILVSCIHSIITTCRGIRGVRAIVVDNASTDGSAEMVRKISPRIQVIELDRNLGFGPANNRGIAAGNAPLVLLLNSDAELKPGALQALIAFMEAHRDCVAVGPRLVYPDGSFHPTCRRFPSVLRNFWNTAGLHTRFPHRFRRLDNWLNEAEHVSGRSCDMVSAACVLVRRGYLNAVGGFDENVFLYEEETDIFLPARRNKGRVYYCGEATVVHHHGASSGEKQASDTSLLHLYRSKYYVYRKRRGRIRARLLYWSDRLPLGLSVALNRLRGRPSASARQAMFARLGFLESFHALK